MEFSAERIHPAYHSPVSRISCEEPSLRECCTTASQMKLAKIAEGSYLAFLPTTNMSSLKYPR